MFFSPCIQAYRCLNHVSDKQYVVKLIAFSDTNTAKRDQWLWNWMSDTCKEVFSARNEIIDARVAVKASDLFSAGFVSSDLVRRLLKSNRNDRSNNEESIP